MPLSGRLEAIEVHQRRNPGLPEMKSGEAIDTGAPLAVNQRMSVISLW